MPVSTMCMIWCFARGGVNLKTSLSCITVADYARWKVYWWNYSRFKIVNIFLQWPLDQNLFFAPKPFTLPKYFGICKPMTENVKVWKVYLVMSWISHNETDLKNIRTNNIPLKRHKEYLMIKTNFLKNFFYHFCY